jgi:ABC-type amino acid transport substrate-binding protein
MQHQRRFLRLVWSLASSVTLVFLCVAPLLAVPLYQSSDEQRVSTIQRIRERGNILVAGVPYDFPPFGFEDADGNLTGFDIDLIKALAELWGVEVEIVKVTADARIPLLVAGEIDIVAAAMTHTQSREAIIDFSQTYFVDGQSLLVRKASGINSLLDLGGKRVGAIHGTTSIQQIADNAEAKEIAIEIVPFAEYLPALDALSTQTIEALTSDQIALTEFAKSNSDFEVVGESFSQEPYGFGVQAGDSQFRHLVDATLQQLKAKDKGGYDEIYAKWFSTLTPYPITILPGKWSYAFETAPNEFNFPKPSIVEPIQSERQFRAGILVDSPPLSVLDQSGKCCIGFGVDLIKEFAKRWTGDDTSVQFVPIASPEQTNNLTFDQWDIFVTSLPQTWELEAVMDFSQPYLYANYFASGETNANAMISFGLPTGDDQFRDLINFTLQAMVSDCSFQQLHQKWFPDTTPYPIEIWPGKPADPFIWNMVQSTINICPEIQTIATVDTSTSVSPSATMSLSTIISTTTIMVTETQSIATVVTTTLTPMASLQLTSDEQIADVAAIDLPPQDYPKAGMSMYSYHFLPFVILLIVALFSSAIYQKQQQKIKK